MWGGDAPKSKCPLSSSPKIPSFPTNLVFENLAEAQAAQDIVIFAGAFVLGLFRRRIILMPSFVGEPLSLSAIVIPI